MTQPILTHHTGVIAFYKAILHYTGHECRRQRLAKRRKQAKINL